MKDGNCKNCIYSGNCYQEQCYTQMKSVGEDYNSNTKYYYMNLGGMFTKVFTTDKKLESLPKYTKEITETEYKNFLNKSKKSEIPNCD